MGHSAPINAAVHVAPVKISPADGKVTDASVHTDSAINAATDQAALSSCVGQGVHVALSASANSSPSEQTLNDGRDSSEHHHADTPSTSHIR